MKIAIHSSNGQQNVKQRQNRSGLGRYAAVASDYTIDSNNLRITIARRNPSITVKKWNLDQTVP